jgi:Ca2+/Na+ antiporter
MIIFSWHHQNFNHNTTKKQRPLITISRISDSCKILTIFWREVWKTSTTLMSLEIKLMDPADNEEVTTLNRQKSSSTNVGMKEITFLQSAKAMAFTGSLNILLVLTPIAIISYFADWPPGVTFTFSLLALAPLAERLGYVTEQLSMHTNETIGGLLNATFGNATELIVAITALNKGLFKLVQLSLLGSILSNLLLVLGTAFFCGGLKHKSQHFGTISSQVNSTLLMLATMGVLFPTILTNSGYESNLGQIGLSRAVSFILFLIYFAFLVFQVS